MQKSLNAVLLACFILTTAAHAESGDHGSWYLGVGAGVSRLDPDTNDTGFSVDDKNDKAFKIFAGYDWSERISTEAYYVDLGKAEISPYGKVEYKNFGISGLYYFHHRPEDRRDWSIYGKIGAGRMTNDSDLRYERNNDYHVMFGAGIEYSISRQLALRIGVDLFDDDAQLASFELLRRFGRVYRR